MCERVPAQARIAWGHGGEEWKGGHALRFDEDVPAIYVGVINKRFQFAGAWLRPEDAGWENKPK